MDYLSAGTNLVKALQGFTHKSDERVKAEELSNTRQHKILMDYKKTAVTCDTLVKLKQLDLEMCETETSFKRYVVRRCFDVGIPPDTIYSNQGQRAHIHEQGSSVSPSPSSFRRQNQSF